MKKLTANQKSRAAQEIAKLNYIWAIRRHRRFISEYKEKRCCKICGASGRVKKLVFHHINPAEKEHAISEMKRHSIEQIKQEMKKCILLCPRCHGKLHGHSRRRN